MKARRTVAALAILMGSVLVACHDLPPLPTPAPASAPASTIEASTSDRTPQAVLKAIPAAGPAPAQNYVRKEFGNGWGSTKGCDTRNRLLARDLDQETVKPGTRGCVVMTGTLIDPYTAEVVNFTKGDPSSMEVQIDHRLSVAVRETGH